MNEKTIRIRGRKNEIIRLMVIYAIMALLAVSMIFPYFYMLMTTFKTNEEALSAGLTLFPKKFQFSAYKEVWTLIPFAKGVLNTRWWRSRSFS